MAIKNYAIELDEYGAITSWSDAAEKIIGYTHSEIIGKHFNVLYAENERENGIPEKLLEEARNNGLATFKANKVRKDGAAFTATIFLLAVPEGDKSPARFYEITHNSPENEIRDSYDFNNLHALVNNTDDLIWSIDAGRKLILSNASFDRRIWEATGKTIETGVSVLDTVFDKETMERYNCYYEKVFAGERFSTTEYVAGPIERWYEVSFYPMKKNSAIIAAICTAKDVTERVRAEIKLEMSEQRFRSLIEHSTDVLVILSKEIKPLYISPSLFNVLGYTDHEGMAMNIFSLIDPVDNFKLREVLGKALANPGIPVKYECRMCHKDTTWRCVEGTITNRLNDTAINGVVYNFCDITERKLAEERTLHISRLYTLMSLINRAVVHVNDEETLFKEVCRVAVGVGKFSMAWIGLADHAQKKIKLAVSEGIPVMEQSLFINVPYNDNDAPARTINGGAYYVCNDIPNSLETISIKPYALKMGIKSCVVFPIKKTGKIYGTINLYAREKNYFNLPEISLLSDISADISFALDFFEKDKAQAAAEKRLKLNEYRLNQAQALAHVGSWELDLDTGNGIWSEEACRIFGLHVKSNPNSLRLWLSFIHPDDMDMVKKIIKDAEIMQHDARFFHRIVRQDGSTRYIYTQAKFEFNKDGAPAHIYGVAHDVTEQREYFLTIKKQNEQLREIAWIQSHKVRAPLATILGLSRLLKDKIASPDDDQVIDGLIQSSESLDSVISEIIEKTYATNAISAHTPVINYIPHGLSNEKVIAGPVPPPSAFSVIQQYRPA